MRRRLLPPTPGASRPASLQTYKYQGPDGPLGDHHRMPSVNIAIGNSTPVWRATWNDDNGNGIQGHVIVGKGFTTSGATISTGGHHRGQREPGATTILQQAASGSTPRIQVYRQYMPVLAVAVQQLQAACARNGAATCKARCKPRMRSARTAL